MPTLLRDYGDIDQVLADIAPRRMLSAAGVGGVTQRFPTRQQEEGLFTPNPSVLIQWLK